MNKINIFIENGKTIVNDGNQETSLSKGEELKLDGLRILGGGSSGAGQATIVENKTFHQDTPEQSYRGRQPVEPTRGSRTVEIKTDAGVITVEPENSRRAKSIDNFGADGTFVQTSIIRDNLAAASQSVLEPVAPNHTPICAIPAIEPTADIRTSSTPHLAENRVSYADYVDVVNSSVPKQPAAFSFSKPYWNFFELGQPGYSSPHSFTLMEGHHQQQQQLTILGDCELAERAAQKNNPEEATQCLKRAWRSSGAFFQAPAREAVTKGFIADLMTEVADHFEMPANAELRQIAANYYASTSKKVPGGTVLPTPR